MALIIDWSKSWREGVRLHALGWIMLRSSAPPRLCSLVIIHAAGTDVSLSSLKLTCAHTGGWILMCSSAPFMYSFFFFWDSSCGNNVLLFEYDDYITYTYTLVPK